jgi:hypothetical protein
MIKALAWKEYREQRGIWLVMACFTGLVLVVFTPWVVPDRLPPWERRALFLAAGAILAWAYGVVCGGMLLAGEREGGTLAFLEGLPARQRQLWRAKCLVGSLLVMAFAAVVAGVSAGVLRLVSAWEPAVVVLAGLAGLGWGLAFSARGESVLGVIGRAVVAQVVAFLVLLGLLLLAEVAMGEHMLQAPGFVEVFAAISTAVLAVMGFVRSRSLYCVPEAVAREARQGLSVRSGLPARRVVVVVGLASLAAGGLIVFAGGKLWPPATLLVGVACGVAALTPRPLARSASEGTRGSWALRVASHALLALVATGLVALPSLFRMKTDEVLHALDPRLFLSPLTGLFGEHLLVALPPPEVFLAIWVFYGFTLGLLCSALCRSPRVAATLAIVTAALGVMVWLPSMLGGGLHFWQTAGIPVAALIASALVYRSRPARWPILLAVAICGLVATAWGLWYRVAEVPAPADPIRVDLLLAELPAPGQDEAGRLTREALDAAGARLSNAFRERASKPLFSDDKQESPPVFGASTVGLLGSPLGQGPVLVASALFPGRPQEERPILGFSDQMQVVLVRGWPVGGPEPELGAWLDRLIQEPWVNQLTVAADLPAGVAMDPRQRTIAEQSFLRVFGAQSAADLLSVHGLSQQAQGNPGAFVRHLKADLTMTRNLRRHSGKEVAQISDWIEQTLLQGLDRWLERLEGQPDLLRQTLALLVQHEADRLDDPEAERRADFLIASNSLDHPEEWLALEVRRRPAQQGEETGVSVVALAWRAPWERQRLVRLLQYAAELNFLKTDTLPAGALGAPWLRPLISLLQDRLNRLFSGRDRSDLVARLRAAQLKVALRLYQARENRLPAALAELVPAYLAAVPADPYDGKPFRYRVSKGEKIPDFERRRGLVEREVPAGQAVLWSVGPDGIDNGGHRGVGSDKDLIFLVPRPAGK